MSTLQNGDVTGSEKRWIEQVFCGVQQLPTVRLYSARHISFDNPAHLPRLWRFSDKAERKIWTVLWLYKLPRLSAYGADYEHSTYLVKTIQAEKEAK